MTSNLKQAFIHSAWIATLVITSLILSEPMGRLASANTFLAREMKLAREADTTKPVAKPAIVSPRAIKRNLHATLGN